MFAAINNGCILLCLTDMSRQECGCKLYKSQEPHKWRYKGPHTCNFDKLCWMDNLHFADTRLYKRQTDLPHKDGYIYTQLDHCDQLCIQH